MPLIHFSWLLYVIFAVQSVMPEFDMPAHATCWSVGYPELVISCPDGQPLLNPTDEGGAYETIAGLLDEFVPLFRTKVRSLACTNAALILPIYLATTSRHAPTVRV